jgi:hypothetical protein
MVPENHEIVLPGTDELREYLKSDPFKTDVAEKLKAQYEVDLHVNKDRDQKAAEAEPAATESLLLTYTRNNAGGIKDAVDFLISRLVAQGLDATTIKGSIPRPKSDSFEESLPFFDSKILQHAPAPLVSTDSPTKSTFSGDDTNDRTTNIFDKLRKPGSISSFSSFLDRRKNNSNSPAGSFFKNGSSNVSKSSLISIESQHSFSRHPWNDSGVNLDDDQGPWPSRHFGESKFPFGHSTAAPGDVTPTSMTMGKFGIGDARASTDSGRPSTSNSMNSGYPGPIGPPR